MRPIKLIEGGHEVNEVFFTDVRVPAENLVGEENKGWTIAKYLLTHERTNIAGVGFSMQALEEVQALARDGRGGGRALIENPLFAARIAQVEIDLEAMKITNLRMLFTAQKKGAPGPETSILKIKGTVIRQELNDLARRALGPAAAPFPSEDLGRQHRLRRRRTWRTTPRATSTTARPRSSADRTRSSATSWPRPCWSSDTWISS